MYKLLFVAGINAYDTLQFQSLSDQEDFFDGCIVGNPIDEYYPPLYKNKIKFAFDDTPLHSIKANYLSLEYKGKTYYYFIDSINYISEDLWEFNITMDTIQTYMFDISKIGKVSRKSINRWSGDNVINRNYIRENMSNEDYDYFYSYNITSDWIYYIFVFSEYHGPNSVDVHKATFKFGSPSTSTNNGLIYYILPVQINLSYGYYYTNYKVGNDTINSGSSFIRDAITHCLQDPYCVSCYCCKSALIDKLVSKSYVDSSTIQFVNNVDGIEFNLSSPFYKYTSGSSDITLPLINISSIASNYISTLNSSLSHLRYVKNTYTEASFSSTFIPYLLDENYIDLKFGERIMFTTYPLHEITNWSPNSNLKYYGRYDFESGFRNYKIYEENMTYDKFLTTITVATQTTMILNTDSWETYYASNKANYTVGIQKDIANIIWGGVSGTAQTAGKTAITGQALRNSGMVQIYNAVDTSNPQGITTGGNTMLQGHMYTSLSKAQTKVGLANIAIQTANYAQDLEITKANVGGTPNSISQGNNALNDLFIDTLNVLIRFGRVRDYENVARKIEYYGYPVNEYYRENGFNGFNDFNIRYYYNICQMDSVILIENLVIEDVLKADFMARLKNGIRLWNMRSTNDYIGRALQYDNVEIAYINQ